jgi:hypothetical protein
MKVYRMKHIPSGMFYTPVRGRWAENQTNLHPTGKIYTQMPMFDNIKHYIRVGKTARNKFDFKDLIEESWNKGCYSIPFVETDWIKVED